MRNRWRTREYALVLYVVNHSVSKEIDDFVNFFFFQAEDGIRDYKVTGVQTCALPISGPDHPRHRSLAFNLERSGYRVSTACDAEDGLGLARRDRPDLVLLDISLPGKIGRASCRERV